MSSALTLAKNQQRQQGHIEYTKEKIQALKQTVAKGATDAEFEMFLHLAQHYGLDPFRKEIWFIKRIKKEKKYVNGKEVWDYPRLPDGSIDYSQAETVIMTSRDGYLSIAQRDPNFMGLKGQVVHANDQFVITQTLNSEEVKHSYTHKDRGAILGAWAAAFHRDRPPVVAYVPLSEYYSDSNIWKKNTSAMILKVAEAFVLKRQFGITGLVTAEEMGTDLPSVEKHGNVIIEGESVKAEEQKAAEFEDKDKLVLVGSSEPEKKEAETLPYLDTVTVTSSTVEKRGKLSVIGRDGQGKVYLMCEPDSEIRETFLGLSPDEVINVSGKLRESSGKRFVMVESIESIPF